MKKLMLLLAAGAMLGAVFAPNQAWAASWTWYDGEREWSYHMYGISFSTNESGRVGSERCSVSVQGFNRDDYQYMMATLGADGGYGNTCIYRDTAGHLTLPTSLVAYDGKTYPVWVVDQSAFGGCEYLTSVTIPKGYRYIEMYGFDDCKSLARVDLPDGLISIGYCSFTDCRSLPAIDIPDSVQYIGDGAFMRCYALRSVTGGEGLFQVDNRAFQDCTSLKTIEFPDSVEVIGGQAFYGCTALENVNIPESVTKIERETFYGCTSLRRLEIPAGVTTVVASAFNYCPNLTSIAFNGDAPVVSEDYWSEESFKGISDSCTIYIRYGTKDWGEVPGKWNGFNLAWQPGYEPPAEPDTPPTPTGGSFIAAGPRPVFVGSFEDEVASVWDGWTVSGGAIGGVLQVKVSKSNGKKPAKVTASLVPAATGKKLSFKGEMDAVDGSTATLACKGQNDLTLEFAENALKGAFGGDRVVGARNLFQSKDKQEQKAAEATLAPHLGAVNVVYGGGSLSLSVAKKGKVKVSGLLGDGTKVSATAQLIIGDEGLAIPVLVTKKANLAFLVWLAADGVTVEGLDGVSAAGAPQPKDALTFRLGNGLAGIAGVQAAFLPTEFTFGGAKWTFPKADTVKLNADKTAAEVTKDNGNPSGLKLTYTAKTGVFKGKFTVYAVQGGKLKKLTANVTGVMVGKTGLGTATVKGVGTVPVTVE